MTIDETPTPINGPAAAPAVEKKRSRLAAGIGVVGVAAVLACGAVAGAVGMNYLHPRDAQALLPPVAVNAMKDDNLVAVKGQAVEIYGNKFILSDATGRALVETGRAGEWRPLVAKGETVTVQGRFDGGFVKASLVIHADGHADELPPPPPPHGFRHGPHGFGPEGPGPRGPNGPGPQGPDGPAGPGPDAPKA